VDALIKQIRKQSRLNTPSDIRVACTWYKPSMCAVDIKPDYYTHESDDWLVFPHELDGLTKDEAMQNKLGLKALFDKVGI